MMYYVSQWVVVPTKKTGKESFMYGSRRVVLNKMNWVVEMNTLEEFNEFVYKYGRLAIAPDENKAINILIEDDMDYTEMEK